MIDYVPILISSAIGLTTLFLGQRISRHNTSRDDLVDLRAQLEQHKLWLDQCRSEKDYLVSQLSSRNREKYEKRNGNS